MIWKMPSTKQRVLVDPAVRQARDQFEQMMAKLRRMDNAEYTAYGIRVGFLNEDGSPKLPEGDPCVTSIA